MRKVARDISAVIASLALVVPLTNGVINAKSIRRSTKIYKTVKTRKSHLSKTQIRKRLRNLRTKLNHLIKKRNCWIKTNIKFVSPGSAAVRHVYPQLVRLNKRINNIKKQIIKLQKRFRYFRATKSQHNIKHHRKSHKYYKGFAYNKHEYKLYKEMLPSVNQEILDEKNQLNYAQQPAKTQKGIYDAINHAFTLKLKNNSQYRKGYMKVLNRNAKEAEHLQVMEYVKAPSFSKPISVFNVKQLYRSNTKNLKGWTSAQDLKLAAHQNRL